MQFSTATIVAFLASTSVAIRVHRPSGSRISHPPKATHAAVAQVPSYKSNATWVTTTVTDYVTYCPESTTFSVQGQTYTATEHEWKTITHCPETCTISYHPAASPTILPGTVVPSHNGTYAQPTGVIPVPNNGNGSKTPRPNNSNSTNSGNTGSNVPATVESASSKLGASSAALVAALGAVAYFL